MPQYVRPAKGDYVESLQPYLDKVDPSVTDILAHLKAQGLILLKFMRGLSREQAEYRYAPDKWSVKDIIGHLVDMERVFVFRALWMARGEHHSQPGVDEDMWAANSNAGSRPISALWREHHVARTDHLYVLRSLDAKAVAKVGVCDNRRMAVNVVPWVMAGHERHHMNVLEELYGFEIDWNADSIY